MKLRPRCPCNLQLSSIKCAVNYAGSVKCYGCIALCGDGDGGEERAPRVH